MFATVSVNFEALQALPLPEHRWLMACLARYADRTGRCWPSMRTLARDAVACLSTVQRHLAALENFGCFTRKRRPGGGYVYQIAERFLPRWAGKLGTTAVPDSGVPPVEQVSRPDRTEGLPKKKSEDLNIKEELVLRAAPPAAETSNRLEIGQGPDRPYSRHARPVDGPNPFARQA